MSAIPTDVKWQSIPTAADFPHEPSHRIAEVRQQQGLSLRSIARQTGVDIRRLREEESGAHDLRLSELLRWQRVLGVPIADLLVDPGMPLSSPIMHRARLVRIMKTAKALEEQARGASTKRLAGTVIELLVEIMPELEEIGPWHSVGQRRSLGEYGRAAERLLSEESLYREWS